MNTNYTRHALTKFLRVVKPAHNTRYKVLASQDKGAYEQILISYDGHEQDVVYAYLLIPKGDGPFPGVLIYHQHNSEWHLGKSEVCGIKGDPSNAFGPALARSGFIVLAPDSVGFEDRRRNQKGTEKNEQTDWLQYFNGMAYRLLAGNCLMTTVLNDAVIGVNILANHSKVDKDKIGVLGHSYGGNTSIFHAAVDERIKFACASGAACSFKNKMENETGIEMSLIIPEFLNHFDLPDVIKCISSRDLLLVSATEDIYSKDANAIVEQVYHDLDEPPEIVKLRHKQFNGTHALTAERFEFIVNWIKSVGS